MISQQTIDQVKSYPDIVPIISEYVSLKKRGRNFIGCCPFHSEKTPSFTVSPEKQIWHCFGCHESGNLITFIRKIDHLGFAEAIRVLAVKLGIEVVEDERNAQWSKEDFEQHKLLDILFFARQYFEAQLLESRPALQYLRDRGLDDKTIREFHLGYAPNSNGLMDALRTKTNSSDLLEQSGLFYAQASGRLDSRFYSRIIFPIIDYQGRTLGFGGRIFGTESDQAAKYLNSPESALFQKRTLFYALHLAKSSIRSLDAVILMEGYMDVITAHQFGFKNTIATMGTALTDQHAQKLKRFTHNVYLAFDQDEAGRKAVARSAEMLSQFDLRIFIVDFPAKDPADFLNQQGADAFSRLINEAKSLTDFTYENSKNKFGVQSIEARSKIIDEILPLLKKESDAIVLNHYIKKISYELNIDQNLLLAKLKKTDTIGKLKKNRFFNRQKDIQKDKYQKAQDIILYLLITHPEIRPIVKEALTIQDLLDAPAQRLFTKVIDSALTHHAFLDTLDDDERKAVIELILAHDHLDHLPDHYQDYIPVLKGYQVKHQIDLIQQEIKSLEQQGAHYDDILRLLKEMNDLKMQV